MRMASACMLGYAVAPISVRNLNACAATSRAPRSPTNDSSAMALVMSCCNSRAPGATAPRTSRCRRWNSCSAWPRWCRARLLKRVFDIDPAHCPQCGGDFKIIAAIEDPAVIAKILTHLCLPARASPRAPARRSELFHAARNSSQQQQRFCTSADDPARIALARSRSMASSRAVCSRCGSRKMPPRAKISRNTRTIDRSMVQG